MGVRAKFNISSIKLVPGNGGEVVLSAVSRGERNADWAAATPCGTITMTVNNPAGLKWFMDRLQAQREAGRYPEIFIDFNDSLDGWAGDGHAFREADVAEGHYLHGNCAECGFPRDGDYAGKPIHPAA